MGWVTSVVTDLICAGSDVNLAIPPFPKIEVRQFMYDSAGVIDDDAFWSGHTVRNLHYGVDIPELGLRTFGSERHAVMEAIDNSWQRSGHGPPADYPRHRYSLTRWTVEDGLPDNKVWDVLRDKDGYLWIATDGGLARFDGERLAPISLEKSGAVDSLKPPVEVLHEDSEGHLWIGLRGGLAMYDDGRFQVFEGQEKLTGVRVNDITPGVSSGLWVATDRGVAYWNGEEIEWVSLSGLENCGRILTVLEEAQRLWVGTQNGLFELDPSNNSVVRQLFVPGRDVQYKLPSLSVYRLFRSSEGHLWIATNAIGVWKIDRLESLPRKIPVHSNIQDGGSRPVWARFAEGTAGSLWIVDNGGIIVTDDDAEWLNEPQLIALGGQIFNVYTDSEGLVWLSTREGLIRLRQLPFATLWFDGVGHEGSHLGGYKFIHEGPGGELWGLRHKVLVHWADATVTTTNFRRVSLGHPKWSSAGVDSVGNFWIGHPDGGIFQVNFGTESGRLLPVIRQFCSEVGELQATAAHVPKGLWLGSERGVFLFDEEESTTRPFSAAIDVSVMLEDSSGRLWIGTKGDGLYRWDGSQLVRFTEVHGLNSGHIRSLHWSAGVLWIGSYAGLNRWSSSGFQSFGPEVDLPIERIDGILIDDFDGLWLNHDGGLSRVEVSELESWLDHSAGTTIPAVSHYGLNDGMLSVQNSLVATRTCLKASDGRLWFAKANGLVVTDPRHFELSSPPPKVFIESIRANGVSVELNTKGTTEISPSGRLEVEIEFSCTSMVDTKRLLIEYRIDELDSDWRVADSNRKAYYVALDPGEYTFRVRSRNHQGRWTEEDTAIRLMAHPHYWETSLFQVGIAFLGLGMVGVAGLVRVRIVRDRMELRRLQSLDAERTRIARDIHDHLGSRLAQTALVSDDSEESLRLVQASLREMNQLIWSIDPKEDKLLSMVKFVADFSPQFLAAAGIQVEFDLLQPADTITIDGRIRQALAAILKEALTNVVKHSNADWVMVRMGCDGGILELSIKDNGTGKRPESSGGANPVGRGKANMRGRAESIGGVITVHHGGNGGTEVTLKVPFSY